MNRRAYIKDDLVMIGSVVFWAAVFFGIPSALGWWVAGKCEGGPMDPLTFTTLAYFACFK